MRICLPTRRAALEALECRYHLSAAEWGATAQLIHQPESLDAFPTITGSGVTIALVDSGVDYTHPALGGGLGPGYKVVGGYDFIDNDPDPMDTLGHGTEVAGMLAANQFVSDGAKYQGIAPAANLVALRIDDGSASVPDARIEAALQWCLNHPELDISIINISYGFGHATDRQANPTYGDEIKSLTDAGVMIVAASGNSGIADGEGIDEPASDPNVISVGAVDSFDVITSYTERGPNLDILAPGTDVYSTLRGGLYGVVDGTSFAAPIVTGTVALMRSIDPSLTINDVRSILSASGKANKDGDEEFGTVTNRVFGRVDLLGALKLTDARQPGDTDPGDSGNANSLAVDKWGVEHLAYYDTTAQTLRYATRSAGGYWSKLQKIDDSQLYQGPYNSIALDGLGKPSIAYYNAVAGDLQFASNDGRKWTVETLDYKNATGLYPSMIFDANDQPAIAYFKKTTGDLRLARRDTAGAWSISVIDSTDDVGRDASLTMDAAGRLAVAYADSTNGDLMYALETPSTWAMVRVDDKEGVSFISMKYDAFNRPVISYYDGYNANLQLAKFSKRKWRCSTLATRGATGLHTNLYFDAEKKMNILYWDRRRNVLTLAREQDDGFSFIDIQSTAGQFVSAALEPINNRVVFMYFDSTTAGLKFGSRLLSAEASEMPAVS